MHRLEVMITRRAEGKMGKTFVGDMTEEKSLELASKLAGKGMPAQLMTLHACSRMQYPHADTCMCLHSSMQHV